MGYEVCTITLEPRAEGSSINYSNQNLQLARSGDYVDSKRYKMDIKVLAAPLDRPEAIDYMEDLINEEQDPFWIMVNVNQLYKDGFPEKEILEST